MYIMLQALIQIWSSDVCSVLPEHIAAKINTASAGKLTEPSVDDIIEGVLVAGICEFASAVCRTFLQALNSDGAEISGVRCIVREHSRATSHKRIYERHVIISDLARDSYARQYASERTRISTCHCQSTLLAFGNCSGSVNRCAQVF